VLNHPTLALAFLHSASQKHSTFSGQPAERIDGAAVSVVRFQAVGHPVVSELSGGAIRSSGRFWIAPERGRVLRSQVTFDEGRVASTFDVVYGPAPGFEVLLPASMTEEVSIRVAGDIRPVEVIRGEARYSEFRRIPVDAQTDVLEIPRSRH
jgi:hypothetical protein